MTAVRVLIGDDGVYLVRSSGQVERLEAGAPRNGSSHATSRRP